MISTDTAIMLYKESSRVATSNWMILFEADIFGEQVIVKIDKKDNYKATVREKNGDLCSRILNGEKKSLNFKITTKAK